MLDYAPGNIYQAYPFLYTPEGTLKAFEKHLEHICHMGFDYVYLMPIHPRGELNRKGTYGSPYAIKDFDAVDPLLGTMEDFESLLAEAHRLGLKVIMDIVLNHSACDCVYTDSHPEFYMKDKDGRFTRKVADWSDVIDFDYSCDSLWTTLIEMLCTWAKKGVDGFRCDVASSVPLAFWKKAKEAVNAINPDFLWIAESVHPNFIRVYRHEGHPVSTDNELYEVFDAEYSYDLVEYFNRALGKEADLTEYAHIINDKETTYPLEALKLNHLENHDTERINALVDDRYKVRQWTAFMALKKGFFFFYAGEEAWLKEKPDFFEKERLQWQDYDPFFVAEIRHWLKLKRAFFEKNEYVDFHMIPLKDALSFMASAKNKSIYAAFDVQHIEHPFSCPLKDGLYTNLIDGNSVEVKEGLLSFNHEPIVISLDGQALPELK